MDAVPRLIVLDDSNGLGVEHSHDRGRRQAAKDCSTRTIFPRLYVSGGFDLYLLEDIFDGTRQGFRRARKCLPRLRKESCIVQVPEGVYNEAQIVERT